MRQDENETLTRVGPDTPAGELLRRYWHPVSIAAELTEEKPIKAVKLLGEKLVVFQLPLGPDESEPRYGLVAEQCRHRLASLAYGRVDHEGIRCPYHGWKYDLQGRCLETPPEPSDSKYYREIRQPAYPVQKLAGLLFAYMGPAPAPLLPRWDVLVREDGRRWVTVESVIDCNWLQPMENSVDPSHLYWLHGETSYLGREMRQYDEKHEFIRFEYGIVKRRITPGNKPSDPPVVDEHPLVFPTVLRHVSPAVCVGPRAGPIGITCRFACRSTTPVPRSIASTLCRRRASGLPPRRIPRMNIARSRIRQGSTTWTSCRRRTPWLGKRKGQSPTGRKNTWA